MRRIGKLFSWIGILLLISSVLLALYNLWDADQAEKMSDDALDVLVSDNPKMVLLTDEKTEEPPAETLLVPTEDRSIAEETVPDHILNPEMEMPTQTANGQDYIGVLEIPGLAITLPVISDWDYPKLRIAPCRYAGSAYQDDLVIMAHNYLSHFGRIGSLPYDSEITFTDIDGNIFTYQVVAIEILEKTDVDGMMCDDWDLTLFTCTVGGKSRVTVRCKRI